MDKEINPREYPKVGSKLRSTTEGTDKAEITDQQTIMAAVFTSRSSPESGCHSFFTGSRVCRAYVWTVPVKSSQ